MIPDPMVRLREMAPEWARFVTVEFDGGAFFQDAAEWNGIHFTSAGLLKWEGFASTGRSHNQFSIDLSTGAAKFPDGTVIALADWLPHYRKRAGVGS